MRDLKKIQKLKVVGSSGFEPEATRSRTAYHTKLDYDPGVVRSGGRLDLKMMRGATPL